MTAVDRQNYYTLDQRLVYITNLGDKIIVPKGFKTNLASVPSFCKAYLDDNDWKVRSPSVVHDFLYSAESKDLGFTRKQADGILLEAMTGLTMRKTKGLLIYFVLRICGASNYEKR